MRDWDHYIGLEEQDGFLSGLIADAHRRKQFLRIEAARDDADVVLEELGKLRTAVREALRELPPVPVEAKRERLRAV